MKPGGPPSMRSTKWLMTRRTSEGVIHRVHTWSRTMDGTRTEDQRTRTADLYKAVLFDIDGTLVDSNDAHAHAWVQAVAEFGHHVEFERVRPLIGMGGDKLMPKLT